MFFKLFIVILNVRILLVLIWFSLVNNFLNSQKLDKMSTINHSKIKTSKIRKICFLISKTQIRIKIIKTNAFRVLICGLCMLLKVFAIKKL